MDREQIEKRAEEYALKNSVGIIDGLGMNEAYIAGYIEGRNATLDEAIEKLRGIKLSDNQRFDIITQLESLKIR